MVTVSTEPENILKPYIVRAIYKWCTDSGFTPYVRVLVCPNTRVPRDYVEGGLIILNIAPTATHKLDLTNHDISFTGRFAGSAMEIWLPIRNVLAIFAKENGQGVVFKDSLNSGEIDESASKASGSSHSKSSSADRFAIVGQGKIDEQAIKKRKAGVRKKGKTSTFLKRIK